MLVNLNEDYITVFAMNFPYPVFLLIDIFCK